jgi:hypothetical protein
VNNNLTKERRAVEPTTDQLADYLGYLERLMVQGPPFSDLRLHLAELSMDQPAVILIANLRQCFPLRREIVEWWDLRDRIAGQLEGRGVNVAMVMRGLTETQSS